MPGSGPSVGPVHTTGHTQSIEVKLETHFFTITYNSVDEKIKLKFNLLLSNYFLVLKILIVTRLKERTSTNHR